MQECVIEGVKERTHPQDMHTSLHSGGWPLPWKVGGSCIAGSDISAAGLVSFSTHVRPSPPRQLLCHASGATLLGFEVPAAPGPWACSRKGLHVRLPLTAPF